MQMAPQEIGEIIVTVSILRSNAQKVINPVTKVVTNEDMLKPNATVP